MIVFSSSISPRLRYTCDFIGNELTGKPFELTDQRDTYLNFPGPRINYSTESIAENEFWLLPHNLLFEKDIRQQVIECFEQKNNKGFFKTRGDFPFDIFAASFYLLSRYEEYLPHKKDVYGRYAHDNSLAARENFLDQPLINSWMEIFRQALHSTFPDIHFSTSVFKFLPTYDIDEAYSFKYKQWWRRTGAALKDLLKGDLKNFSLRRKVLCNKIADPFDSYDWMDKLHTQYKLEPRYFFLVAESTGKFDKNILPDEKALQQIIQRHGGKYTIGVHPSWQSGDKPALINKEIKTIEMITGKKISSSRQHFIRFTLPQTYRRLIEAGITEDFSMGYGSVNGFRASVASSFYWYDLEKEAQTRLLLRPFCYMEANSFFEQKIEATASIGRNATLL